MRRPGIFIGDQAHRLLVIWRHPIIAVGEYPTTVPRTGQRVICTIGESSMTRFVEFDVSQNMQGRHIGQE